MLVSIAVDRALARCNRRGIPLEMEQAVAVVILYTREP